MLLWRSLTLGRWLSRRVPTGLIARLPATDDEPTEDDLAEVSGDYRLSVVQVRAALDFEHSLRLAA